MESIEKLQSTPRRGSISTVATVNDALDLQTHGSKFRGLKWHHHYDEDEKLKPRVLMIDYHKRDAEQLRKITAQEFSNLEDLKKVYRTERTDNICLRVFHVQNSTWGERYLLQKFKLDTTHSRTQEFAQWVKDKRPPRRAGKLMMTSKTWKTHTDPWRGVAKTAFGMDYMKVYTCDSTDLPDTEDRVMGLQGFDKEDNAIHAYDIYSQRLSVYVQYQLNRPQTPDPDLVCPYGEDYENVIKRYDNGNTIIIFDNSNTFSIEDTLVAARGDWEMKWRRLPFMISQPQTAEDAHLSIMCMKAILHDIFKSVVAAWEKVLDLSWEHVSILEDAIYEQPADESRAPQLWKNSAYWLRFEKLMFYHVDTMNEMRRYLADLSDIEIEDGNSWLDELPSDFDKLGSLIQEDLVKPTANLSELMYKSVGIRDSRASLQLGTSMWRLSWITFIFLPLTFIVGFFGMNVETFAGEGTPSIKWFFIIVIPFFAIVLIGWYILKHRLARHRRAPMQRGWYEALFTQLQEENPTLWSRQGPREYVEPVDWVSRMKWRIIKQWTNEKALPKPGDSEEPIGAWNRIKQFLIKKWTKEIKIKRTDRRSPETEDMELGEVLTVENTHVPGLGAVIDEHCRVVRDFGASCSAEAYRDTNRSRKHHKRNSRPRSRGGSSSDGHNSGILVEERREGPDAGAESSITQARDTPCEHRLTMKPDNLQRRQL
ncbi:hypothetical protein BDZ91DRAFT_717042 [Kalaharituber pfeilii]|nr:hypothetical protein BDZ91DRAFT_717042 [Kalaharituber pfeilii]